MALNRPVNRPANGFAIPEGIPDENSRPYKVEFADLSGVKSLYKVSDARPDKTLGIVLLILELYKGE